MSGLTLYTAPAGLPVTRTVAKEHCKVDSTAEDTLMDLYIAAATAAVENQLNGTKLVEQTWEYTLEGFPAIITLPLGPVQEVTHIKYLDTAGVLQTLDADLYRVVEDGKITRVQPVYGEVWPSTQPVLATVTIRFVVGYPPYGSPATDYSTNVPAALRNAVLLTVRDLYDGRGNDVVGVTVAQLSTTARSLLAPYQLPMMGARS